MVNVFLLQKEFPEVVGLKTTVMTRYTPTSGSGLQDT